MGKIRYTVRLYRSHDIDLLTFLMTRQFDVMHAIYCALSAFQKGEAFVIEIPPGTNELPPLNRVYSRSLVLDKEKDAAIIEMVEKIKPGRRNNFFKNLLRVYLSYPYSNDFFSRPSDQEWFDERTDAIRKGRRVVKAGKIRGSKIRKHEESSVREVKREHISSTTSKKALESNSSESFLRDNEPVERAELSSAHEDAGSSVDEDAILALFDSLGGED